VTSASSYGRVLTRLALEIDPVTARIVEASADNEIVTRDVAADAAVAAIVGKYGPRVATIADEQVGSVTGDLRAAANDAGESVLGNVIADAQLAATRAGDRGGAVIAFMNRGYRYRAAAEPGRRIDVDSIRIDGRPVGPQDLVRVAASDFLLNGGDGSTLFAEATDRQAAVEDLDALVAYFKANSPVAAPPRNRIVATN
jgi:2',3'-cyclic-nucleotide 2'-phosphodiesterase (5'-nucleotidase family)